MTSRSADLRLDVTREEGELRAYLGNDYDRAKLEQYEEILDDELAHAPDADTLYRTSRAYLYNLTAFAMTGTKLPYLRALTAIVPPGSRVLDYGCGIGSDGLMLLEAGYSVEFADFDNPSTEFLRWRLRHRGLTAPVHNLDDAVPSGFDAAYAFDVIEHVQDPYDLLRQMEARAGLVMVNLLEYEKHEQPLHFRLPIARILGRAASCELEYYRVHHGSSHLVAYGPTTASRPRQARNVARLARGFAGRARAAARR